MNSRAAFAVVALAAVLVTGPATIAQMTLQPTSRPIVTAENEPWYVAGAPITSSGLVYFPAGPITHFNGNEMVRSGHFQGIPLYTRATSEPYSLVFVPLAGGLMHPYERRRDWRSRRHGGDLDVELPDHASRGTGRTRVRAGSGDGPGTGAAVAGR